MYGNIQMYRQVYFFKIKNEEKLYASKLYIILICLNSLMLVYSIHLIKYTCLQIMYSITVSPCISITKWQQTRFICLRISATGWQIYTYLIVQASHQKGSYNILPPLILNMKWFKITFCTDTFVMNIHL